jgi:hypothetical protein
MVKGPALQTAIAERQVSAQLGRSRHVWLAAGMGATAALQHVAMAAAFQVERAEMNSGSISQPDRIASLRFGPGFRIEALVSDQRSKLGRLDKIAIRGAAAGIIRRLVPIQNEKRRRAGRRHGSGDKRKADDPADPRLCRARVSQRSPRIAPAQ